MIVKALSVRQPYASLIAQGDKTIETRIWSTKYRGPLLIVASKSPKIEELPVGVALALVELLDCRPMVESDQEAACCDIYPRAVSWVLKDENTKTLRRVKPFAVKGLLGLYDVVIPEGVFL